MARRIYTLQELKEQRGVTLADMAIAMGCTISHLSRVVRGSASPSPDLAQNLANYFDNKITRDQILFPQDYAKPLQKAS